MDLTRFMHGSPGQLLNCGNCGMLLRDERRGEQYESDLYDTTLMKHLYPRYVRAFQEKKLHYQPLLRPGAEVLEVGSHLGAFLEVSETWGWRPRGLDIGVSTSRFAKLQGGLVERVTLEDYSPKSRRPEAIFVWNCFEQLEDPSETLRRSAALLDSHGLLIIRVPNAAFYLRQRQELNRAASNHALKLLGYNNLLGFPYLHGYKRPVLEAMLKAHGFQPMRAHRASLLTPPYPDMSGDLRSEWKETRRRGEYSAASDGPWLELVSRRAD